MIDDQSKTITIDDREYEIDSLSETAKGRIVSIRIVNQEIALLERKIAIMKTARISYAASLRAEVLK